MRREDREPYADGDESVPCTCTDDCPSDCKGESDRRCRGKCKACHMRYMDFLSDE